MSNPDSFIEEVTEEVRRDRLFAIFRRYGWIGVLVVVGIVGGAAWNEWQKARADARAEAFGDAMIEALDMGGDDRRAAIAAVPADGGQLAVRALVLAAETDADKPATLAALDALAADTSQPQLYRDLAVLRRVMVAGADMPLADRRTALEGLAAPGGTFRPLANEQLAYLLVEEGRKDEAIALLQTLLQDQAAPQPLRARVGQVIVALGGTVAEPADSAADQG